MDASIKGMARKPRMIAADDTLNKQVTFKLPSHKKKNDFYINTEAQSVKNIINYIDYSS